MAYWSDFTSHYVANRSRMPAGVAAAIRRDALARLAERMAAGRGDGPLLFNDLIERIEVALGGA